MKFEDLKNIALIKNPKSGQYEFREKATGKRFLTDEEKLVRENLEKGILGDDPLGPAMARALEEMSLSEILTDYPDDTDMIIIESADLLQSGLVEAMNPLISKEAFAKAMRAFELIVPQIGELSAIDRARIIDAAHKGGLVDVLLEQAKLVSANQRKMFFEIAKASAELEKFLQKKPSDELLDEERSVLEFIDQTRKNLPRFSDPIKKAVGEAFKEEKEET